jgi:hypothetical protein
MSFLTGGGDWKSTGMVRAEQLVMERAAALDAAIAKARATRVKTTPLTEAEAARIHAAATAPGAPDGMRELASRVDAGRLAWQEVFSERGMRDREVRAAVAEAGTRFDDGGVLRAVAQAIEAGPPSDEKADKRAAIPVEEESFEFHTYRL